MTYFNLGETPAEDFKIVDDYDERLVAEVVDAGGEVVDAENGTITWTLPFTGGELGSLFVIAGLAAASGVALRRLGR